MEHSFELTMTKEVCILADLYHVSFSEILQAFIDATVADAKKENESKE